jgi:elongation factor 1-gamma
MSAKLIGYRFSPTVQEVLHVIELAKAPVELQNIDWEDTEARKTLSEKSPTGTFPFLETSEGLLSESRAIENYLAEKYKPELLGQGEMQRAQVRQWVDFASFEIAQSASNIVYPIFGWKQYCKEEADKSNNKIKEFMKVLEQQLNGKKYIIGENLTLADVSLFCKLKYLFQLVFPKGLREKVFPKVNTWFGLIAETPEVKKTYGKITLCNQPVKPFIGEKKEEKKKEEKKKEEKKKEQKPQEDQEEIKVEKKKINPLDLLPPSKLELEVFKRAFLNNKDKEDAMKKFWEVYDPEGYSLWWLEYQNLPTECKVLFRTSNSKGMFLQKCDALRRYAFAVHGVYGVEDDYKIRGLWMFRGKEIPQEMKDNDLYEYITFRKLDINKEEDKKLVHDYWTKLNETDEVEGRKCADVEYFN